MKTMKTKNHTECTKILCDGTDTNNYSIHYRFIKFYVRRGMTVDKIHE